MKPRSRLSKTDEYEIQIHESIEARERGKQLKQFVKQGNFGRFEAYHDELVNQRSTRIHDGHYDTLKQAVSISRETNNRHFVNDRQGKSKTSGE